MLEKVVEKVGVLPVFTDEDGTRHYLIYWPKAKNPDEQDQIRHWQLARGTIENEESHKEAVVREAEEELGVTQEMCADKPRSLGVHLYESSTKGSYPIHWYEVSMKEKPENLQPDDAYAVRWATAQEIQQLFEEDEFKPPYYQLFKTLISQQHTTRGDATAGHRASQQAVGAYR